jgi:predicted O-methyltransferase YrrM
MFPVHRRVRSILAQAFKPKRFKVMLNKIIKRISDINSEHASSENLDWIKANCSDFEELAMSLNAELWYEAQISSQDLKAKAEVILSTLEYRFGGGAAYPYLYFIARQLKPSCIVETGVALGYSSYSFLSAIAVNGEGKLYSSDFPYFRIPNPEKYIGIIVDESLRQNWDLYIEGDELNLPNILEMTDGVDLFHYDSDKSYSGRKFAISQIQKRLSPDGVIVMDDIQDNSFFRDYIVRECPSSWSIFEFEGKFVGVIGKLDDE